MGLENDTEMTEQNSIELQRAARFGWIEEVKRLIPISDPKFNDSEALRLASDNWNKECVELLIPVSDPNHALQAAARFGIRDAVERLIPICDPKADDSRALVCAAQNGNNDIVELLIPVSDPKANGSWALRLADNEDCAKLLIPFSGNDAVLEHSSFYGYIDEINRLIQINDPELDYSSALKYAACEGHTEVVKLLIPVGDPKANDSWALQCAAEYGHEDIVELLIPVSDVELAIDHLRTRNEEEGLGLIERVVAEIEKQKIAEAIGLDEKQEQAPNKKRKI